MKMKYLALAGVTLLFVYEFYAASTSIRGDTISEVVWRLSSRPLVPFAFGFLMGHFFWQSGKLRNLAAMKARYMGAWDEHNRAAQVLKMSHLGAGGVATALATMAATVVKDIDEL